MRDGFESFSPALNALVRAELDWLGIRLSVEDVEDKPGQDPELGPRAEWPVLDQTGLAAVVAMVCERVGEC